METNNLDLKKLWNSQKVEQPSMTDLLERVDSYKRSSRRQTVTTNLTLGGTIIIILFIWYYFQPEFITTKIGIVLAILSMVIYLIAINKMSSLLKQTDEASSNQDYLANLLEVKAKQQTLHTTLTNVYFLMLSAGLALYMYEYTSRMETLWALTTYAVTGAWIMLNWLYFRPRIISKQQTKLNELIARLEAVKGQLGE